MGLKVRNDTLARLNYLGLIGLFGYFTTRFGAVDYKKFYRAAPKKHL